MHLGEMVADS